MYNYQHNLRQIKRPIYILLFINQLDNFLSNHAPQTPSNPSTLSLNSTSMVIIFHLRVPNLYLPFQIQIHTKRWAIPVINFDSDPRQLFMPWGRFICMLRSSYLIRISQNTSDARREKDIIVRLPRNFVMSGFSSDNFTYTIQYDRCVVVVNWSTIMKFITHHPN